VTSAALRFTPPQVAAPEKPGRAALSGTFAASMERLLKVVARTTPAPAALIAMMGDDRRTFSAGHLWHEWFAHDAGALIRSGLLARALQGGGVVAIRDARVEGDPALRAAANELNLVSVAAVAFGADDRAAGLLCALDDVPREWASADLELLADFAQIVVNELGLRTLLSERERREQLLQHDSLHDPLTGLPNRGLFMKRLEDATYRARRGEDGIFAVLFMDVDGFKLVNDSMGHHVGDEMLVTIARRLEECVRGGDIVARLGGDEFAILLERVADVRDAALVAGRVQQALAVPLSIGGYDHSTSASIGVALSTGANQEPEYILRCADTAMYRAKHSGRGRYEMFDRAMHAEALTRLQIESDLRDALERNEFFLQFQPIISLRTGTICGAEALVRWKHDERGIVSPATFVPLAEDTGLVVPLGRWVLREACIQATPWARRPEGFHIAVNLSAREFGQPDLVRTVAALLEESGLPAGSLNLEITESAIIDQMHPAIETVEQLRELGVGIHLDDFGTGYSALSYLHRLPLDAVKIDRSFTSVIDTEDRPLHVVRAIISLAHAIGLAVVAEGVSSEAQLALLRSIGCDYAQGFIFSRPCSAAEMEGLLASGTTW
jgi:diguanylate cyclase (GGDEF)-like protein